MNKSTKTLVIGIVIGVALTYVYKRAMAAQS